MIPNFFSRLTELEQIVDMEKRKNKIQMDQTVERIKLVNDRVSDMSADFSRIDHSFSIRDTKIDNNFEIFLQYKEKINTEMNQFTDSVNKILENCWAKISDTDI